MAQADQRSLREQSPRPSGTANHALTPSTANLSSATAPIAITTGSSSSARTSPLHQVITSSSTAAGVASTHPISGPASSVQGAAAKASSHQHFPSLSPRSNPAFSDPDFYPDREDADDVFSNPDTAELEARSDATGSTSPDRATSPNFNSPDSRGRTGYDQVLFDPHIEQANKPDESLISAAALHHRPSRDSQITQHTATPLLDGHGSGWTGGPTLTPTTSTTGGAGSPSLRQSPSARRASLRARPLSAQFNQPLLLHDAHMALLPAANDMPSDPFRASQISTLFAHSPGPSLPASSAATSQGSPVLSALRLALSTSPTISSKFGASKPASASGSPSHERGGFQWSATADHRASRAPSLRSASRGPLAAAASGGSGNRTNPTTRPSSPDQQGAMMPPPIFATPPSHRPSGLNIAAATYKGESSAFSDAEMKFSSSPSLASGEASSRAFAGRSVGLGFSSPRPLSPSNARRSVDLSAHGILREDAGVSEGNVLASSESSIFERDIEHRDARHLLSKSEAVDVAIPSVLDDAVEAIIEGGERPLEIVAPLPSVSAVPHALTATALSAHSICSPVSSHGVGTSSPAVGSPVPMPNSAGFLSASIPADGLPPGSIAAQIAERLGPLRSAVGDETSLSPERMSRALQSQSPGAVSTADSNKSLSPGFGSASAQHILEGSPTAVYGNSLAAKSVHTPRDLSPTSHAAGIGKNVSFSPTSAVTGAHSRADSLSQQPASSAPTAAATVGVAVPSLPLPNPFRSDSPSVAKTGQSVPSACALGFVDGAGMTAASVTMSVDGAIIPSSESAIRELSLDGMADVLAEVGHDASSLSPIVPRKSTVAAASASISSSPPPPPSMAFVRRDTNTTITAADVGAGSHSNDALQAVSESASRKGGEEVDIPGGFPEDIFNSTHQAAIITTATANTIPTTRRLSFFSYADIINDTPAELVDFEEVVSREMASSFVDETRPPSSSGIRAAARSPRASFGGAGMAKPFPSAPHSDAAAAAASNSAMAANKTNATVAGRPVSLGKSAN